MIAEGNDLGKVPITERTVKLLLRQALQAQGKHLRTATNRRQKDLVFIVEPLHVNRMPEAAFPSAIVPKRSEKMQKMARRLNMRDH